MFKVKDLCQNKQLEKCLKSSVNGKNQDLFAE